MKKILLGAAILVSAIGSANANIVQNGSFEANSMSKGAWNVVNLNGWDASGGYGKAGMELRNNLAGIASDGKNFVELDVDKNGWISQTIDTVANQSYVFSFDYADRVNTKAATNGLKWEFGNESANLLGGAGTKWQTFSQTFTATSNQTLLKFTALGTSDSYGSTLDNISVSPVPEAEEWAMMLLGLSLIGFVSKRKTSDNTIKL